MTLLARCFLVFLIMPFALGAEPESYQNPKVFVQYFKNFNANSFMRMVGPYMSAKDEAYLREYINPESWPEVKEFNGKVRLSSNGDFVDIKILERGIEIKGQVFTISQPLDPRKDIARLEEILGKRKTSFLDLVEPRAEAGLPVVAAILYGVGVAAESVRCSWVTEKNPCSDHSVVSGCMADSIWLPRTVGKGSRTFDKLGGKEIGYGNDPDILQPKDLDFLLPKSIKCEHKMPKIVEYTTATGGILRYQLGDKKKPSDENAIDVSCRGSEGKRFRLDSKLSIDKDEITCSRNGNDDALKTLESRNKRSHEIVWRQSVKYCSDPEKKGKKFREVAARVKSDRVAWKFNLGAETIELPPTGGSEGSGK